MIDYTVDLLIFGISNKENTNIRELSKRNLSIILVKRNKEPFKNMLVLPGGYVNSDETSEEAAKRVLEKETGLTGINLYLSSISDGVKRDPRNRTVSASYIALVDVEKIHQELKEDSKWYDVNYYINSDSIDIKLDDIVFKVGREIIDNKCGYEKYYQLNKNKLGFDHDIILTKGIMDLRNKVQNTDIIFNLFPERFTIGALEQVYGDILKEKVVNSAFRRTFADKLEVTKTMVKTGGHRPSYLYRYKDSPKKVSGGEIVDVYNPETLDKTGETIDKLAAHRLGIWHSSIHLVIVNNEKTKVLLQKRSSNKDLYPNMWDISVGGHIASHETDVNAVKRELKEELGIDANNIKLVTKFKEELNNNGVNNKEVVSLFMMSLNDKEHGFKLQKEEVSEIKWFTKFEMEKLIKDKKIIPHKEDYDLIREILN